MSGYWSWPGAGEDALTGATVMGVVGGLVGLFCKRPFLGAAIGAGVGAVGVVGWGYVQSPKGALGCGGQYLTSGSMGTVTLSNVNASVTYCVPPGGTIKGASSSTGGVSVSTSNGGVTITAVTTGSDTATVNWTDSTGAVQTTTIPVNVTINTTG